jgi:hypothetical protein
MPTTRWTDEAFAVDAHPAEALHHLMALLTAKLIEGHVSALQIVRKVSQG